MGLPGGHHPVGTASRSGVVSAWCPAQERTSEPGLGTSCDDAMVMGPLGWGLCTQAEAHEWAQPWVGLRLQTAPARRVPRVSPEPGRWAAPPPWCPGPAVPCDLGPSLAGAMPCPRQPLPRGAGLCPGSTQRASEAARPRPALLSLLLCRELCS